jgi:hypothetical protein
MEGCGSLCTGTYSWGFPGFGAHGGGSGHGVLEKVFPWKMGLRGDLLIIKSILVL